MKGRELTFERTFETGVLSSFFCGVRKIDQLIHKANNGLNSFISENKCEFYIVKSQDEPVALFVFSESSILVNDIEHASLELDFIAVKSEYREMGIGRTIIDTLEEHAKNNNYHFLTVGAYHDKRYSAEGFYLKCGFERNEEEIANRNIIPMLKYLEG